jgi:hypothetical protein
MKAPALGWQLLLVFVLSLLLLAGLIGWLQNVHILTGNGMFKAIQGEPWIEDPAHARLDNSNFLYFPLYGALCRVLDWVGVARGVPWKQFAYINALWASIGVVVVYALVHVLTRSALVATLAAIFHAGCGFFLLLAVINEDIMPAYVITLAAMALASLWFDRPDYRDVVIVGAIFTLGWLMEWRVLFPALPALVLALGISQGSWMRRLGLIATLVASILAVSGIVQLLWDGHPGAVGLHELLWTGKGVASGWAGLAWDKAWNMLSGLGNYFLLVGGFVDTASARRAALPLTLSVLVQAGILAATFLLFWPRRDEPLLRALAAVFLGTAAAGLAFNLYGQPQDPQMQINVMPWLTVAWALLVGAALRVRPGVMPLMALLSCVPLAWNATALSRFRGGDTDALAALDAIERHFPPQDTVFLHWGFEPIGTWQHALWGRTWDWDGMPKGDDSPSNGRKLKLIALTTGAIRHPEWTPEQHAAALRHEIELALDRGYRIAVSKFWDWDVRELAGQLGGMAAAQRAPAIHRMLHDSYEVRPVFVDPTVGAYYELRRR